MHKPTWITPQWSIVFGLGLGLGLGLALGPLAHPLPACTSIMVGKKASTDGSVMTSHTCDSHRTSSQVLIVPPANFEAGAERALVKRCDDDTGPMQRCGRIPTGKIPQVAADLWLSRAGLRRHERLSAGDRRIDV